MELDEEYERGRKETTQEHSPTPASTTHAIPTPLHPPSPAPHPARYIKNGTRHIHPEEKSEG